MSKLYEYIILEKDTRKILSRAYYNSIKLAKEDAINLAIKNKVKLSSYEVMSTGKVI